MAKKKKKKQRTLDVIEKRAKRELEKNSRLWVLDRCENGEALLLADFFSFMKYLGLIPTKSEKKAIATKMKKEYASTKKLIRKQEKMGMKSIRYR